MEPAVLAAARTWSAVAPVLVGSGSGVCPEFVGDLVGRCLCFVSDIGNNDNLWTIQMKLQEDIDATKLVSDTAMQINDSSARATA